MIWCKQQFKFQCRQNNQNSGSNLSDNVPLRTIYHNQKRGYSNKALSWANIHHFILPTGIWWRKKEKKKKRSKKDIRFKCLKNRLLIRPKFDFYIRVIPDLQYCESVCNDYNSLARFVLIFYSENSNLNCNSKIFLTVEPRAVDFKLIAFLVAH